MTCLLLLRSCTCQPEQKWILPFDQSSWRHIKESTVLPCKNCWISLLNLFLKIQFAAHICPPCHHSGPGSKNKFWKRINMIEHSWILTPNQIWWKDGLNNARRRGVAGRGGGGGEGVGGESGSEAGEVENNVCPTTAALHCIIIIITVIIVIDLVIFINGINAT